MNLDCRVQDQLNTSEPTAPYIIGRELNLEKLPNQQWESNPQPSAQLRPMTIRTRASTETATTATTMFCRIVKILHIYDMKTDLSILYKRLFWTHWRICLFLC